MTLPFVRLAALLALLLAGCSSSPTPVATPDLSAYPWIFLRDGQPFKDGEKTVSVIAVGDVMLGRGVSEESDPLGAASPWLQAADLTLGNLECAIAPQGAPLPTAQETPAPGLPYLLVAPPSAVEHLSQAGFDLLGLANNHALDRGLEGLAETGAALQQAGLIPLGAAAEPDQAYEAVIRPAGGLNLAFLAFNAVPSPRGPQWSGEVRQDRPESGWALAGWDREQALTAVRSARQRANAVIVSIHWGYEYETRVDPAQRDIARDLVEAGANLVVGHHPHVVQPIERFPVAGGAGEALVAYSLGNFVFDQGFDRTGQGLALRLFFDEQGLRAVQALPVSASPRPRLLPPEKAENLAGELVPQAESQAWHCDREGCTPAPAPSGTALDEFRIGEIDLSGDGEPEQATLDEGRLHISGPGLPDWDSPPEWRVIDLAAGDPNRDGRQELLLALHKPDRSGVLLSHPFILGYREGEWRVLWGGSAVSDPILEVELGDLDGDGLQELAVLEELHAGQGQAVSLWRWHGWGFSQVWRSEPGTYANLRLVTEADGQGILLLVDR